MKKTPALALLVAAAPLVFLGIIYNSLPQSVPLHFGADLKPDRFGNKAELWWVTGLISVISAGVYLLFANLHRFDPKRAAHPVQPVFKQLAVGLVFFLALINMLVLLLVKGSAVESFLLPLIGLLFAFTGYCLNGIAPNYFAGFRLPWTLHNDENWRKTHRLGGRLWLGGGLLIAVVCGLLPLPLSFYVFFALTGLMVCIPCIYSYRLFKHNQLQA